MSRFVKALRIYPTYKLTSYVASFMDAGRKHETPGSEEDQRTLLLTAQKKQHKLHVHVCC